MWKFSQSLGDAGMAKFTPFPVIESSLHMFGGHLRTVAGGWTFFEQKHQAFELMCVIDGHQTTQIKNQTPVTYGPGDIIIISPGTLHVNFNASKRESMTYCCIHFNIESLKLRAEIIRDIANIAIHADNELAKVAVTTMQEMLTYTNKSDLSREERDLKIEITFYNFLIQIIHSLPEFSSKSTSKYTEREAQVARSMAAMIENGIENEEPESLNVGTICQSLNISTGYGHRVFRKVYGSTPLHFIEEQKYSKAKMLLGIPDYSIEEVAYMTGFNSLSNFSKQFKKWSNLTPSKYQQQVLHKREVRAIKDSGFFE
ncbi:AraC family transcriptional regulator [Paucilactobacillus vaccinostercus DSM 20634]|uniref:AraC family transcriptional regulator n=2 Tax=Paucilactobacillus vaccinostercus TaxID=176291 RepID=A0A0R2AH55_9LACO|nr:AraC family transcriptional regulator [Paucilactobacillus vaccinostercus DSM 20634]